MEELLPQILQLPGRGAPYSLLLPQTLKRLKGLSQNQGAPVGEIKPGPTPLPRPVILSRTEVPEHTCFRFHQISHPLHTLTWGSCLT